MKCLIAYFSASNVTKKLANDLSVLSSYDVYEIKPKVKYTRDDLNWRNPNSRSSIEMQNQSVKPEIITGDIDISQYDRIYIGFPIWWYQAPTIINAFLEAYNFNGKEIALFATSGGSDLGETVAKLQASAPNAKFIKAKLFNLYRAFDLEEFLK